MTIESKVVANRIRLLREKLGLSKRKFSLLINNSCGVACYYEQGKRKPSIETCYRMIELAAQYGYEIDLEWLRPEEA